MKLKAIIETMDTRLDDLSEWVQTKTEQNSITYAAVGWADHVQVAVSIKYTTIQTIDLTGMRILFGVRTREQADKGEKFSTKISIIPNAPASRIIGGVAYALTHTQLPHQWDFAYVTAKDAVQKRLTLYTAIMKRVAAANGMQVKPIDFVNEGGVLMAKAEDIDNIIELIKPIFGQI